MEGVHLAMLLWVKAGRGMWLCANPPGLNDSLPENLQDLITGTRSRRSGAIQLHLWSHWEQGAVERG